MANERKEAKKTGVLSPCPGLDERNEGGIHIRLAGSLCCTLTEETITDEFDFTCDLDIFDVEGGGSEWLKTADEEQEGQD